MLKVCVGMVGSLLLLTLVGCTSGVYYPFGTGKDTNGNTKAPPPVSQDYYNNRAGLIIPS